MGSVLMLMNEGRAGVKPSGFLIISIRSSLLAGLAVKGLVKKTLVVDEVGLEGISPDWREESRVEIGGRLILFREVSDEDGRLSVVPLKVSQDEGRQGWVGETSWVFVSECRRSGLENVKGLWVGRVGWGRGDAESVVDSGEIGRRGRREMTR